MDTLKLQHTIHTVQVDTTTAEKPLRHPIAFLITIHLLFFPSVVPHFVTMPQLFSSICHNWRRTSATRNIWLWGYWKNNQNQGAPRGEWQTSASHHMVLPTPFPLALANVILPSHNPHEFLTIYFTHHLLFSSLYAIFIHFSPHQIETSSMSSLSLSVSILSLLDPCLLFTRAMSFLPPAGPLSSTAHTKHLSAFPDKGFHPILKAEARSCWEPLSTSRCKQRCFRSCREQEASWMLWPAEAFVK